MGIKDEEGLNLLLDIFYKSISKFSALPPQEITSDIKDALFFVYDEIVKKDSSYEYLKGRIYELINPPSPGVSIDY